MAQDLELKLIIKADGSVAVGVLNRVEQALGNVADSAGEAAESLDDAAGGAQDAGQQTEQTASILERGVGTLKEFAKGLAAAFTVKALFDFAKNVLAVNRAFEDLRATLKSVTGSAEAAVDALDRLRTLARDTPFELQDLAEAFIKLKSFGLEPTNEVMGAITNQASKLGASTETLNGIVLALGQAWAKGKLQGEEILQLVERGVPVWELLAQATGKNAAELQKMSEKGQLGRDAIFQLIVTMGQLASGANAEAVNTISGSVSNLSDAWNRMLDNLLNANAENAIKRFTTNLALGINRLADSLSRLDAYFNGASSPQQQLDLEARELLDLFKQVEEQKKRVADIQSNGQLGSLFADLTGGNDLNNELNVLERLNETLDKKLVERAKKLDALRKKQAADEAAAQKRLTDSITRGAGGATDGGGDSSLNEARQLAQTELQIEIDKIDAIEQLAAAMFANELATAKQRAAEKLALAKDDKNAQLAIAQELAESEAETERNRLESNRSFAEERLKEQLAAKQKERALTSDSGEQALIGAEVARIKGQIETLSKVSGLAVQTLANEEAAAAAQRAQANARLIDSIIAKYDELTARRREFEADAAIVKASNLSLQRKAELLDLIAKKYAELGGKIEDTNNQADQFAENAARNIQSSFADFLFDPFDKGLKGMLLGFVNTIRRILAEALSADILNALGLGGKDNKGGNLAALGKSFLGLFGPGADEVAQVATDEATKTALVTGGETERAAAVSTGAVLKSTAVASGQAAQSGAVAAGETIRGAAETAGQTKSLALTLVTAGKKIHAFAATAAAGAYAALADIPYIGPVLGAIAAALTYAAVLAFGALTGGAFFARGGRVDATPGGRVSGRGTPESDSIPAYLSNKEAVLKAASVEKLDKKYGPGFIDYLNKTGELPAAMKFLAANLKIPALNIPTVKFNAGGRLNKPAGNTNVKVDPAQVDARTSVSIINVVDKSLVHEAMAGAAGTRIVLNALQNNPRAVRQSLGL